LTKRSAAEAFGAEQMAWKLCEHLEEMQRKIATRCDPVCAFNAENNLIGQMVALLRERRYTDIHTLLEKWNEWLEECSEILRVVSEGTIIIGKFCEFYEESNGAQIAQVQGKKENE